jgi:hypothetical protein
MNRKGNELRNLDDNYEDDRPDSQTQLHITVAGAKVLNRKGKELQNFDPEKKWGKLYVTVLKSYIRFIYVEIC